MSFMFQHYFCAWILCKAKSRQNTRLPLIKYFVLLFFLRFFLVGPRVLKLVPSILDYIRRNETWASRLEIVKIVIMASNGITTAFKLICRWKDSPLKSDTGDFCTDKTGTKRTRWRCIVSWIKTRVAVGVTAQTRLRFSQSCLLKQVQ